MASEFFWLLFPVPFVAFVFLFTPTLGLFKKWRKGNQYHQIYAETHQEKLFPTDNARRNLRKSSEQISFFDGHVDKVYYGLDDVYLVRRFSVLVALFLFVGLSSYYFVSDQTLSRRILEKCLTFAVTFAELVVLVAVNSFILKYILRYYLLRKLQLQGHESVLNVACGTGFFLNGIASKLQVEDGGKAVGVDIFEGFRLASEVPENLPIINLSNTIANVISMRNHNKVELYHAQPYQMQLFEDNSFDVIVVNPTAIMIKPSEIDKAFHQWKRILKPGGKIILVDVFLLAGFQRRKLELTGWETINTGIPHFYLMAPVFFNSGIKSVQTELKTSFGTDYEASEDQIEQVDNDIESNSFSKEIKNVSKGEEVWKSPASLLYWRIWAIFFIGVLAAIIGGIPIPIAGIFFKGEYLAKYFY